MLSYNAVKENLENRNEIFFKQKEHCNIKKCNLNTQKMNIERNKYMDKYISILHMLSS